MRFLCKICILLLLFLCGISTSSATHIVGGEMTYQYKGNNTYLVRLDLYIDCKNGSAGAISQDATAYFGVFNGNTNKLISGYPVNIARKGPKRIVKLNYNCITTIPDACVDQYWYETTLTLPPITGGYYLSFQRCCRNNSITNLNDAPNTGANYWTKIPDSRTLPDQKPNSSAVFKELPPNFLCTNYGLKFDHSATDADGDSLAYDLFWPYLGADRFNPRPDQSANGNLANPPFTNVTFGGGYNYLYPIDANPALAINDETGLLTMEPTKAGQFVVGIRVREYRKGVLISETKRDYQFNVDICVIDVVASFFSPKFICGYTYQFSNKSSGAQRYFWDFGIPGRTDDTSIQAVPIVTFPAAGKYRVKLIAYKNNCLDSFVSTVTVVAPNKPKLPADSLICEGKSVTYQSNITGEYYLWSTGSKATSITVNKPGTYWLEVSLSSCSWRDTVTLSMDFQKVKAIGDTVYCSEVKFLRDITANAGMSSYQWSTNETTQKITVNSAGEFIVNAKTINNCPSSDTVTILRFDPVLVSLQDTIVCKNNPVRVDVLNYDATKFWSTGDTSSIVQFTQPGVYSVKITRGLCSSSDAFTLSNYLDEFELGPDLRFCNTIDTFLNISNPSFSKIVWNGDATLGRQYHLTQSGRIDVSVFNSNNCPEVDFIHVLLFPNPGLDLGADTLVCLSVNPILDAGTGMARYRWQDKSGNQYITAVEPGLYWVEVTDKEGCRSRDSVRINKSGDVFTSKVYMPNAFTPDGNGRNELYPNNQYVNIGTLYSVKLYNRWGEKIADYNAPDVNWDGNIHGIPAPEGVYVFMVNWIGCDNELHSLRGDFHLIR